MKVLTIYLSYLWVGILHAFFVGCSFYMCFGKTLVQWKIWQVALLFFPILLFFEVYWIPLFNYLGLELFITSPEAHDYFGITEETNLVTKLHPRWFNWIFISLQAIAGAWIGRRMFRKMQK